jgi:hypothetical protein
MLSLQAEAGIRSRTKGCEERLNDPKTLSLILCTDPFSGGDGIELNESR